MSDYFTVLDSSNLLVEAWKGIQDLLGPTVPGPPPFTGKRDSDFALFGKAYRALVSRKIPSERRSIAFAAVARMMSSLPDDHTNVYEPEEHPGFVAGLGLQPDIGIGVILAGTQPPYIVRSIVPGTPAANNRQIQEGDTLNFVGPTDVTQTTITREQLDKLLAGDEGSLVVVKVSRNGGPPTAVTLRRASYLAPVLTFRTTGPNNEVGVLTLREFPESYVTFCDGKLIEEELDAYLRGLPPAVKLLIFDLRGNRGGCTSSLAEVVARFVDGQVVVKSTSRGDDIRQTPVDGDFFKDRRVPLAVLIDENSASASELFAQAIKDWKRGIVVGRKSAGSVGTSRFYDIGDGAALQIKVADAVSGLGVILDGSKNGVMPDVTVEDADLGSPDYGGDRFITKAAQTAPARYAELVPPVPSFSCKLVRPSNEIRDDLQDLLATGPMIPEVENRRLGGEQVINTACEFVSGALDVGKAIRSLQRRGWRGSMQQVFGPPGQEPYTIQLDQHDTAEHAAVALKSKDYPKQMTPVPSPVMIGDDTVAYQGINASSGTAFLYWRRGNLVFKVSFGGEVGARGFDRLVHLAEALDAQHLAKRP